MQIGDKGSPVRQPARMQSSRRETRETTAMFAGALLSGRPLFDPGSGSNAFAVVLWKFQTTV